MVGAYGHVDDFIEQRPGFVQPIITHHFFLHGYIGLHVNFPPSPRFAVLGSVAPWCASEPPKNLSAGQLEILPMKKMISLELECVRRGASTSVPLSQAEMEYEMDHRPAPWECAELCFTACLGCLQRNLSSEMLEKLEVRKNERNSYGKSPQG